MGVIRNIADGLVNVVANLGTGRDKASHSTYDDVVLTPFDLLTAYRNSWLARAIIDYPAEDATRKWRKWRAEAEQITAIENEETRLGLQKMVQEAMISSRLYGGAAIYINTKEGNQQSPLTPGKEVISLVVLTGQTLRPGPIVRDIGSVYYGMPEYYTLNQRDKWKEIRIHPSRLVIFKGEYIPDDTRSTFNSWGDSVLQSTLDAIKQVDSTMANMASLVFEAKVDVFRFDGFAKLMEDNEDELVLRRLSLQARMKGINGAIVTDKLDEYEQKNASFAGLPDVVAKFMDAVSGASRIPVTRLYGRAAVGLSGSGDGDERVYFDRIGHIQSIDMKPAMALLDDCIVMQALGSRPEEIYYEWTPLRQLTESERAEVFVKTATALRSIAGSTAGPIVPTDALSDAAVNEFTEQGMLPGLDQAIKKYGSLHDQNKFEGGETEQQPPPSPNNEEQDDQDN